MEAKLASVAYLVRRSGGFHGVCMDREGDRLQTLSDLRLPVTQSSLAKSIEFMAFPSGTSTPAKPQTQTSQPSTHTPPAYPDHNSPSPIHDVPNPI